jgi:membrane-bound lytic murein transglycosylase F
MNQKRKRILLFLSISLLLITGFLTVRNFKADSDFVMEEKPVKSYDLSDVLERGVLRAATDYNSTNYFIYRGEPMGFHLELLSHFASHIGVDLDVSVSNDLSENIDCLTTLDGCDIIAANITVTQSRNRVLQFSEPHSRTRQMLVQRKPETWNMMSSREVDSRLIRSLLDLAGKEVHVQTHSAFVSRLQHLMEEIGDTIYVVERQETVERLIEEVAEGKIDYTISDEQLAYLHQLYYANIDAQTPISFEQNLSWAVREGSVELLAAINEWLKVFKTTRKYSDIYNKYYRNPRIVFMAKSELHSLGGGKISVFDEYFKRYADIVGWDWRLIASLSYQESRFNPSAESWAGAYGIMQLMPGTAEFLNIGSDASVQEHIAGGIRYLKWLDGRLSDIIADEDERVHFILASYNMGIGHVLDARRLAEKYGKNPNIWSGHVDYFVLNKSEPKYYLDPVVRHGYARGSEPYNYVTEIMDRYRHYTNAFDVLAQYNN